MDITVIICTYNRADSLRITLESARGIRLPAGVTWELLLVDNNSTDSTAEVCKSFAADLPLRYLRETQQGLSHARNLGCREATGSVVAFTDDDVNITPEWLAELWSAAEAHPEADFFGGPIQPCWESEPPQWIARHSADLLAGITIEFSMGDEEAYMERDRPFFGANMAYRHAVMVRMGAFREELGMKGKMLGGHEETEYMRRLLAAGSKGLYVPGMLIHHRNRTERITEGYVLRWYAAAGRCHVRAGDIKPAAATLFGAPRYLWRKLLVNTLPYLTRRFDRNDRRWILSAIYMAESWGAILEFRSMTATRRQGS